MMTIDRWIDRGRARLAAAIAGFAVVAGSCGGGGETPEPAPTATTAPTPTTAPPTADPTDPTIAAITGTVSVVESEDEAALLDRVRLSDVPCSHTTWPQPPCTGSQAEGTPVARLAEDTILVFRQLLIGRAPELHGAATVPDSTAGGGFPLAPFGVVFRTTPPAGVDRQSGVLLVLDGDGLIISLRTGCRATPNQLLASLPHGMPVEIGYSGGSGP